MITNKPFWFTSMDGLNGIVVGKDEITGERKAYINFVTGNHSEVADTIYVKERGAKVSLSILKEIVDLMEKKGE